MSTLRAGPNPDRGKSFPLLQNVQKGPGIPPSLLFNGYRASATGIRLLGHGVKRSPSSSAEVKNGWSYTSTPLI